MSAPVKRSKPLEVSIGLFAHVVKPVMQFTPDDRHSLPILDSVLVETVGPYLVATATDRFRIAIHRAEVVDSLGKKPEKVPPFRALIPTASLHALFRAFTPPAGVGMDVTLHVDGDYLVVEKKDASIKVDDHRYTIDTGMVAAKVRYGLTRADFPKINGLVREALDRESDTSVVGFNWQLLASFAVFSGRGTTTVVKTHPVKPTVITDNDTFVGLIMPRRVLTTGDDGSRVAGIDLADGWDQIIGAAAPTPKEITA